MTREQRIRSYARHLALRVTGGSHRDGDQPFMLWERYRFIGIYHSLDALERGIRRYGDRQLENDKC